MLGATPLPSQYDLSCATYSPDGKVFQTEYAQKAVDGSRYAQAQRAARQCQSRAPLGTVALQSRKLTFCC